MIWDFGFGIPDLKRGSSFVAARRVPNPKSQIRNSKPSPVDLVQIPTIAYNPPPGTTPSFAENRRSRGEPSRVKIRISGASLRCGPTGSPLGRRDALVQNGRGLEGVPGCPGGFQTTPLLPFCRAHVARMLQPVAQVGKRGQVQFAGTARRVLRTNWTCPLFPGQRLHKRYRSSQRHVSIPAGRWGFVSIRPHGRTDDTSAAVINHSSTNAGS